MPLRYTEQVNQVEVRQHDCAYCFFFCLFHAIFPERSRFRKNDHFYFQAVVVLKLLVSLMGHLVACSARIAGDKRTDKHTHRPSTVTLAAHARQGLIKYRNNNSALPSVIKTHVSKLYFNSQVIPGPIRQPQSSIITSISSQLPKVVIISICSF